MDSAVPSECCVCGVPIGVKGGVGGTLQSTSGLWICFGRRCWKQHEAVFCPDNERLVEILNRRRDAESDARMVAHLYADALEHATKADSERDAAIKQRDEARETSRRLNRRCQRAEAMPKWADLGIAAELRSAIEMVRHRYRVAAHCAKSAAREWADHTAKFYADLIREWATKGRPANHTCPPFDAIIDEMRADKANLAAALKQRDEAVADALRLDMAIHVERRRADAATARAERAEKALRWYAEEYNYHPWDGRDGAKDEIPALDDRGAKAREALEGGPHA